MNFTPDMLALVLSGKKTQTRRPADRTRLYSKRILANNGQKAVVTRKWLGMSCSDTLDGPVVYDEYTDWRVKWMVGRTYAVAPGRGKHGVGRIRLLDIRLEPADVITEEDARAEGFDSREAFFDKLRSLYGANVDLTAPYYALTFELVQS